MFNELTGSAQYMWSNESLSSTESKKEGKDQKSIQSSTTPDPGYPLESNKLTIRHHQMIANTSNNFDFKRFEALFFVSKKNQHLTKVVLNLRRHCYFGPRAVIHKITNREYPGQTAFSVCNGSFVSIIETIARDYNELSQLSL